MPVQDTFDDVTIAQLLEIERDLVRERCKDIFFLSREILPHHFTSATPDFHREIVSSVLKEGLVEKGRKLFVCVSVSHDKAKELYTIPLKREFESNNALIKYFPGIRPSDKWTEDELEFTNGVKVVAKGRGQAIRDKFISQRPNVILIDDLEDEEAVNTSEQRQTTQNWFDFDVLDALSIENRHHIAIAAPRGSGKSTLFLLILIYQILFPERVASSLLAFIGTILHDDSMLNKLIAKKAEYADKYSEWKSLKYKALSDDNKSIWQERLPVDQLLEEKRKDLYRFSREKQNEPIPIGAGMFKKEYFKTWETLPDVANYYLTVDLACTDKEYSDYTVIMATCVDPLNTIYVAEYTRQRYADPDEIINEIFRVADKYPNIKSIGIEKTAFQRFLIVNFMKAQKLRPLGKKRYSVCELKADRDKTRRIAELQPWFSTGQILIRHTMVELQEELLMFPRATHDDVADCLAYVVQRGFISAPDPKPIPKVNTEGTFFEARQALKKYNKLRANKSNNRFRSDELYMRALGWK